MMMTITRRVRPTVKTTHGNTRFGLLAFLALCGAASVWAAPPQAASVKTVTPEQAEFFEKQIRPLLADKCFSCHGSEQQLSGLRLDALAHALKGGARGASLIPGDADKSLLVQAVRYDGALKMPPTGKLKPAEIAALVAWVKMGAPWPDAKPTAGTPGAGDDYVPTEVQRKHWAFLPIVKPPLPKVKNKTWGQSPIDRFVLVKLEAKGLPPAPPADKRTLLRRANFDLIGLPPTPQEMDAFLRDKSPDAFAKAVDRLLASPRYGERWGRHWLDVARYADTKGYVFTDDPLFHHGYTYRDYVIRAFNTDLPYNRFIVEQLAADRLPLGDDKRPLAALGYLTLGRRFLNDPVLINDDRIDVTCRGLMALTVGCARCHNHKFDPIPTKDYYSLMGVFASSSEPAPEPAISPRPVTDRYAEYQGKIKGLKDKSDALTLAQIRLLPQRLAKELSGDKSKEVEAARKILDGMKTPESLKPEQKKGLEPFFEDSAKHELQDLGKQAEALQKSAPPTPEYAMALQDNPTPAQQHVFKRGNPGNPGDVVPRRFLQILSGTNRPTWDKDSGRLQLAQAIASRDNPLTARVLVNRVWLYHFGKALVRTPGDFGMRGETPTHPELLDYLAARFMDEGWSLKKLHRWILLSSAWQQSSQVTARAALVDSENRLLSHQNRQRLDLEGLRDSLLAVSGQLDTTLGGPSVELTTAPYSTRRTLYGYLDRQNLQGMYRTFDFASTDTSSAQRFQTTVPQQALFMMNSGFVQEQARHLAQRPELKTLPDAARIRVLYRLLFQRNPAPDELAAGLDYLRRAAMLPHLALAADAKAPAPLAAWESYAQALLMTNEFAFVD